MKTRKKMEFVFTARRKGSCRFVLLHDAISSSGRNYHPHEVLHCDKRQMEVRDLLEGQTVLQFAEMDHPSWATRVFQDLLFANGLDKRVYCFSTRTGALLGCPWSDTGNTFVAHRGPNPEALCRLYESETFPGDNLSASPCGTRVAHTFRMPPLFVDVFAAGDDASPSCSSSDPAPLDGPTAAGVDVIDLRAVADVAALDFGFVWAPTHSGDGRLCAYLADHNTTREYHVLALDVCTREIVFNLELRTVFDVEVCHTASMLEWSIAFISTTHLAITCALAGLRVVSIPLGGRVVFSMPLVKPAVTLRCSGTDDLLVLHSLTERPVHPGKARGRIVVDESDDGLYTECVMAFSRAEAFGENLAAAL